MITTATRLATLLDSLAMDRVSHCPVVTTMVAPPVTPVMVPATLCLEATTTAAATLAAPLDSRAMARMTRTEPVLAAATTTRPQTLGRPVVLTVRTY
jgi:hypothetical protein